MKSRRSFSSFQRKPLMRNENSKFASGKRQKNTETAGYYFATMSIKALKKRERGGNS
jgi:hypothetical protein